MFNKDAMKKIIYIVTMVAVAYGLSSCEPAFLDNKVYSKIVKENYYQNLANYETALTGCYYYVSGRGEVKEGNYCVGIPVIGEAGTDECFIVTTKGDNWSSAVQLDQYGTLVTTNLYCQEIWLNHYTGMNAALEITDRVFAMTDSFLAANPRYPEIAAEACFLQALWYFNLVRIFGGVPVKTHAADQQDEFINVGRNTIQEVYERIFFLLDYAKANLPVTPFGDQLGRAKRNSAYALSAKVNLHIASSMNLLTIPADVKLGGINSYDWTMEGKSKQETIKAYYEQARADARTVLDSFAPNYLMPEFTDCFYPNESSKEILFEGVLSSGLSVELGGWFGSLFGPNGASAKGGGQHVIFGNSIVSMSQFTFYNSGTDKIPVWQSQDKRFSWTWATYRVPATGRVDVAVGQIYNQSEIGKFRIDEPPTYNQDRTPINIPIIRTSEICLVYAEAQAELDNIAGLGITDEALRFINVVRKRADVEEYTTATVKEEIALKTYPNTNPPAAANTLKRGNTEIKGWTDDTDIGHLRRAILNERTLELIGEGHRWYDLVRMGVLPTVVPATAAYANTGGGIGNKPTVPTRSIQPYHIFRPIPSREISLHQGALKQNYGYTL